MISTALLVLAKAPEPGRAKTRLTPAVNERVAADIAAASLLDTLDVVHEVAEAKPFVAWTGEAGRGVRAAEVERALDAVSVLPQRGQELGERLSCAHQDVAGSLPAKPIVQIGMDTPQVTSAALSDAAALLHRQVGPDAVLGPAADGGWWLLGLRDPRQAKLLRDVPMSRPDTGALTLEALRCAGLRTDVLGTMSDVDTMVDAERVARSIPGSRFAAAVHAAGTVS